MHSRTISTNWKMKGDERWNEILGRTVARQVWEVKQRLPQTSHKKRTAISRNVCMLISVHVRQHLLSFHHSSRYFGYEKEASGSFIHRCSKISQHKQEEEVYKGMQKTSGTSVVMVLLLSGGLGVQIPGLPDSHCWSLSKTFNPLLLFWSWIGFSILLN